MKKLALALSVAIVAMVSLSTHNLVDAETRPPHQQPGDIGDNFDLPINSIVELHFTTKPVHATPDMIFKSPKVVSIGGRSFMKGVIHEKIIRNPDRECYISFDKIGAITVVQRPPE